MLLRIALSYTHIRRHTHVSVCVCAHEEPAEERPPPSPLRSFDGDALWEPTHGNSCTL